ncbi:MAG: hypothetical protein OQK00_04025, partial [Rhodobacteraceae bacterium]|nr:hypothetical protein [Paracoccaceae bacterium]
MGFIAGCFLVAMIAKVFWDFFTGTSEKRRAMLQEYASRPFEHIFLTVWMTFFVMFFFGVFFPPFGEILLTNGGWQVWEVGIIGFFGMTA